MANYATLLAAIRAAIKANDQQAITGDVLQAVLTNIVGTLGTGYQFAGVATPATNPGTPDGKVWYLAPAGSYPNFGATAAAPFVVPAGSFGVFTWSDTWTRQTIEVASVIPDVITYAECTTPAATAAKVVAADNFRLVPGVQFRVKFAEANTAANPTLNIGGTGALPIVYDGEAASATNSWEAGEVVLVYYDGTSWQASAAQGGGGTFSSGEKVKETGITDKVETGNALVTTGAVYQNAALINYKSSPVYDNEAIQQYIRANVVANGGGGGRLTGNNAFDTLVVPVEPGKTYVIRGLQNTGKNNADAGNIFFYSADPSGAYTVIGGILVDFVPGAPVVVNIPEGATYLIVYVTCRGFTPAQGGASWVFDSAPTVSLDMLQSINLVNAGMVLTDVSSLVHYSDKPVVIDNADIQQYILKNTYFAGETPGAPIGYSTMFDILMLPVVGGSKLKITGLQDTAYIANHIANVVFYAGQGTGYVGGILVPFDGTIHEVECVVPNDANYVALFVAIRGYNNITFDSAATIAAEYHPPEMLTDNDGKMIKGAVMRRKHTDYALSNSDLAPYINGNTVINGSNGRIENSNIFDSLIIPVIGGERVTINGLKWYGTVPTDIGEIWFYTGDGQPTAVLSYIRASREPDVPVVVDVPVTATFMGIVITARNFSVSGQVLNYDASATVNVNVVNGPAIYTIWGTPTGDEIEQRLANSGGGGGGAAPSFDMGLPRDLPKVYITSDLLTVVKDSGGKPTNEIRPLTTSKNEVGDLDLEDVKIRIESDTVNFEDAIVISYQGQSSLTAAKKNFSIDTKNKHRFGKWLPMDGFHLKGYNSDWLHIRDIMSNRIYEQMLQTRPPEQRRPFCEANDFAPEDVALLVESGVLCHIDGFPIELYVNGEYWGVYSWNLKKHRSNYHLGKSDVKNIQIDPNWQTMTPAGWNWRAAEVRNPKSDSGNTEFIEGTVPNDGEVKTWWTNCLNRLAAITATTTLESLKAWMNIDSWVDTLLLVNFLGDWDIINRNNLYTTWDGDMLSILPYDHDASFGMGLATNPDRVSGDVEIASGTNIFERAIQYAPWLAPLLTILDGELRARYKALRMAGVFSYDSIKAQFDAWTMQIGFDAYKSDLKRWSYEGYGNGVTNPGFYDSANKRLAWVKARIAYLDNLYGFGQ